MEKRIVSCPELRAFSETIERRPLTKDSPMIGYYKACCKLLDDESRMWPDFDVVMRPNRKNGTATFEYKKKNPLAARAGRAIERFRKRQLLKRAIEAFGV